LLSSALQRFWLFLLSYPVQWLHRFLPHGIAVTFVFFSALWLWSNSYSGLRVVSQAQQLINSITFFLNSLVPLTERLEEFLRNRDIQVDLNAIQQQLQDQILAGLSAGIGYSLLYKYFLLTLLLLY